MPRWVPTAKSLLNATEGLKVRGAQIAEMLTGLLPVSIVDRQWSREDLNIYGASGFYEQVPWTTGGGAPPEWAGNTLELGSVYLLALEREVLVRRVTAALEGTEGSADDGFGGGRSPITSLRDTTRMLHLFTPDPSYEPAALRPGIHFSWLSTKGSGLATDLSRAVLISGANTNLQQVTVQPFGLVQSIGPIKGTRLIPVPQVTSGGFSHWRTDQQVTFLDWHDPPIVIKPGGRLCVQSLQFNPESLTNPDLGKTWTLVASFWYSERDFQGDT